MVRLCGERERENANKELFQTFPGHLNQMNPWGPQLSRKMRRARWRGVEKGFYFGCEPGTLLEQLLPTHSCFSSEGDSSAAGPSSSLSPLLLADLWYFYSTNIY